MGDCARTPTSSAVAGSDRELETRDRQKGDRLRPGCVHRQTRYTGSVVVVVALPFACYGQIMTAGDLPDFGAGAAEELKETFDVAADAVQGKYWLGSHSVWIERAKGTPKGHPESQYTFEMVCTVLEKGAACWMAMAADDAGLQAFEQGAVSLDGEPATALVPASAFPAKP